MQKQPTTSSLNICVSKRDVLIRLEATHLGCCFQDALRDFGLAPNTNSMIIANVRNELILGPSFGVMINLETLRFESSDCILTDVLEKEQLQLVLVNWMKYS